MRLSRQIPLTSAICAAALLVCTLLVTDNDSWVFRVLLWLGSVALCGAATFLSAAASFLLCGVARAAVVGFNSLFEKVTDSEEKRERFQKRFYWVFFVFSLAVLAKFSLDFAFAQFTVTQLFLSGAVGMAHGAFVMILIHRSNRRGTVKLLP